MSDWFRQHFLQPVHDKVQNQVTTSLEGFASQLVHRAVDMSQGAVRSFEAAGSTVNQKVTDAARWGVTAVDSGVREGLQRVGGAAATVLQKVENAGTRTIDNLERGTMDMARSFNTNVLTPAEHAIEQPIQNAWHGIENVAGRAWANTKTVGANVIDGLERPFRYAMWGGLLIGGYMFWRVLEDQREEQMVKRRRYR